MVAKRMCPLLATGSADRQTRRVLACCMRWSLRGSIRYCCIALLLACAKEKSERNAPDAGTPLLSEEEWLAAITPRSVPHEIWTAACDGARVGQEYPWIPSFACYPKYDANNIASPCVLVASCQSSADCTAQPNGICRGRPSNECIYPGNDQGKSCEQDSECTFRPGGKCRPSIGGGDTSCIPTGECQTIPVYACGYPLDAVCHSDADCMAAPGGTCKLSIAGECLYNECQSDSDCGPRARCDCQEVRRCLEAQCYSADDCGGFACDASPPLVCGNIYPPIGYYCRSEQDECRSGDDCVGDRRCVYDPGVSHWRCGDDCITR
jgi:hypothetical protein